MSAAASRSLTWAVVDPCSWDEPCQWCDAEEPHAHLAKDDTNVWSDIIVIGDDYKDLLRFILDRKRGRT